MKKLSVFAVAFAAMVLASCGGGNKNNQANEEADSVKSFEQAQVEAGIKMHIDSLASALGQMKQLPFMKEGDGSVELTAEEKQVKPDYLLPPTTENAATLAEKYRLLSALGIDKRLAKLYYMPVDEYEQACSKLLAEINDPSFKDIQNASTVYETTTDLYNAMEANGRINYFWQLTASSLVEELYILSQNSEKFLASFNDEAAANSTFRIVLILDALDRLTEYDSEIQPVVEALRPLSALNATTVDELRGQLAEAKDKIDFARNTLLK
jgi:hypothetical protein